MILENNLEKIPGEIELSKKLGVSRTVIREAIRILEYEGNVKTRRGSGTYVLKDRKMRITFSVPIEVHTDNPKHIIDLLEVRRGLEGSAIKLVISTATNLEVKELERKLLDLEEAMNSNQPTAKPDYRFHMKIFEIAHNTFLKDIFDVVFNALKILWQSPLGIKTFGDVGLKYHRTVFENIYERDTRKAIGTFNKIMDLDIKDIEVYIQKRNNYQ